jgi:hypothetical protein
MALVRDSDAGDLIIMSCEEVLSVRIIQIACYNTAPCYHHILFPIRMQKY